MGTENPNRANFPSRPFTPQFGAPRGASPFSASGPVVGAEASAFRPPPSAGSQVPVPSFIPAPLTGQDAIGFRPVPPSRPNDPAGPPPPSSYGPPPTGPFQRFPSPQFSTIAQPPVATPPVRPPAGLTSAPPVSVHPQPQQPVFMGSPSQSMNSAQSVTNVPVDSPFSATRPTFQPSSPPMRSSYPAPRGTLQSAFPGYPTQAPPVNSVAFPSQPGMYGGPVPPTSRPILAPQGGPVQSPLLTAQTGLYPRESMQNPGSMPPMASTHGLAEDFSSLSLGSVPGSFDTGIDSKALPRPLDGDVEQKAFTDMYPLNCNSRYLRLTTAAIPNSQSLASRWHLPLGAVVCPLAVAPDGVSIHAFCIVSI